MATLSCSEPVFLALVVVSSVSVAHTAFRPLIPDVRPLNCAFCMACWAALGVAAALWTWEAVLAVPLAGFLAAVASGLWPWAFYSAVVEPTPQLDPQEPGGKV